MATQKVVATSANLDALQAAIMAGFAAQRKPGGRAEKGLLDGRTIDQLAEDVIRSFDPETNSGMEILVEPDHFRLEGSRLESIEQRIKRQLADDGKRDDLHRLTNLHCSVKAVEGVKNFRFHNPATGKMETIDRPNCIVITCNPGMATRYAEFMEAYGDSEQVDAESEVEVESELQPVAAGGKGRK